MTRKVDQLVRALSNETGISRSTVSRICTDIDEAVAHLPTRRLDHTWFPYLFLELISTIFAQTAHKSRHRSIAGG